MHYMHIYAKYEEYGRYALYALYAILLHISAYGNKTHVYKVLGALLSPKSISFLACCETSIGRPTNGMHVIDLGIIITFIRAILQTLLEVV